MKELVRAEVTQRLRGRKWWLLLVAWFAILFLIALLVWSAATHQADLESSFTGDPTIEVGPVMFGTLALFILGLMGLVLPSLTATAINGERDRGTLAILQATLLEPWEIAAAKFFSAYLTALVFLLATVPLTLWAAAEGGVPALRILVVYLILGVASALFLAMGLAASASIRRPGLSALASYVAVFAVTAGLPILFGLSLFSAGEEVQCSYPETEEVPAEFRGQTFTTSRTVVGWRWILLAPDPFVVLADAAPRQEGRFIDDPLTAIRSGVRASREAAENDPCFEAFGGLGVLDEQDPEDLRAVWPTGLAIDLLLFAGAAYLVLRKLQVPARKLGTGERVA